jgi:general secretion pathway protein D
MNMNKTMKLGLFCTFIASLMGLAFLQAQTISEKKASFNSSSSDLTQDMQKYLRDVNDELKEYQTQLYALYADVQDLYDSDAPEEDYRDLLNQINEIRQSIEDLEKGWQQLAADTAPAEGYALWHQPETTIGQLVIDYGSQNYVYMLTPEIASMKLSIDSNLPVPRASWDEMLELILVQNGIGFKQLNPFLRQLYLFKQDKSSLKMITNQRCELELLPPEARILFMLSPEPSEVKRVWFFLDKFVNPNSTVLQMIGRDILIVAPVSDVKELLKLYDFVSNNRGDRDYRIIPLRRIDPEEMGKILSAVFDQMSETPVTLERMPDKNEKISARLDRLAAFTRGQGQSPTPENKPIEANGLRIIPISNLTPALFLYGTREELRRAESIIMEVEKNMGGAREKVIYWYTTKHSDPLELADMLVKIYALMVTEHPNFGPGGPEGEETTPPSPELPALSNEQKEIGINAQPFPQFNAFEGGFYLDDRYIVNPDPREEIDRTADPNRGRTNFIVDPKTGAIVMVVEAEILPKLKELIWKLDIPVKMVQIEVLLFEKRINNRDNIGLNLLKIGSDALNVNLTGLDYNVNFFQPFPKIIPDNSGITTFFISRKKTSMIPAYDAVYQFLISQEDITINASPSILTLNQTEAHIAIEDEISVNTGVIITPVTNTTALNNTFARARYGIKIDITPIIHMRDSDDDDFCLDDGEEDYDYITLQTDLVFETINGGVNPAQPDVTRRVINNEVRIPDGQTVILGGLRRKMVDDTKDAIPFLGEVPFLGKFFSTLEMTDNSVEMFIFITPKIITDPKEELLRYRTIELTRRPGDVPYFLCSLEAARNAERDRILRGTMQLLFGRPPERCGPIIFEEYDGR